jgi:hypothetical protein
VSEATIPQPRRWRIAWLVPVTILLQGVCTVLGTQCICAHQGPWLQTTLFFSIPVPWAVALLLNYQTSAERLLAWTALIVSIGALAQVSIHRSITMAWPW